MARPLRIEYPGAYYHVTSRGNEKQEIFKSQQDREKFLSYLESSVIRYGAVIHAYCLMDNHYHLLLETPLGNLAQIMRHINGAYTAYFNTKSKRAGHLFQGRYKAILIEADEYAKELSRYVHLNPVRAGITDRIEEYPWSSYNCYIGKKKSPKWLNTDFILGCFGERAEDGEKEYRRFTEERIGQEYKSPLNETVASTILGNANFVKEITERYLSNRQPTRDMPAVKALTVRPSFEAIIGAVKLVFGDDNKSSLYFCHRYSGARLKEIGEYFGMSESAVSQANRRFAEKMEKEGQLKQLVKQVEGMLNVSYV